MRPRRTRKSAALLPGWGEGWEGAKAVARRSMGGFLRMSVGLVALAAGAWVLLRLEDSVLESPRQAVPARIELVDVPADLASDMRASLESFARVPWSSPTLCRDLAQTLERAAWVKQVVCIQRFTDRRVEVRCTYRSPLALVQMDEGFYLVDEDGVRLPGRYANHPSMTLVQGVNVAAPLPGAEWAAPELRAGLELVKILASESFADQITAVLVANFGGRVDAQAAHIELATDRAGGRIIWGSAPGAEIEENTVAEKLELLRSNYRRFGRADAGRGVIDVSVHPDRIITPT